MPSNKIPVIISTWEHDPGLGNSPAGGKMIQVSAPVEVPPGFITVISSPAPAPAAYAAGTAEFRHWVAAEALNRGSAFWSALLPGTGWFSGKPLPVFLDLAAGLNANYNRNALRFYHGVAGGMTIYSGESPDVVCHEQGHAVLDAIKPQIWDLANPEAEAFHESFGDMSAILCALQLESMRTGILAETGGFLYTSSRLSRIAEQLAFGIRQRQPAAVEPDCLRNAVNSFIYQSPHTLPEMAPAGSLSAAPHSFSRVFTAAFFEGLAKMFELKPGRTEKDLLEAANDMGTILVRAVKASDTVPRYYVEVALKMISASTSLAKGYETVLKQVFIKHGFFSPADDAAVDTIMFSLSGDKSMTGELFPPAEPQRVSLPVQGYNIGTDAVEVFVPVETFMPLSFRGRDFFKRRSIFAEPDLSPAQSARVFLESLIQRGRLKINWEKDKWEAAERADKNIADIPAGYDRHTHELRREGEKYVLRRLKVDCGHCCNH